MQQPDEDSHSPKNDVQNSVTADKAKERKGIVDAVTELKKYGEKTAAESKSVAAAKAPAKTTSFIQTSSHQNSGAAAKTASGAAAKTGATGNFDKVPSTDRLKKFSTTCK